MRVLLSLLIALLLASPAAAQVAPPAAKPDGKAVEHGAQPNDTEVRPGNRDGDAPSAAAGDLLKKPGRRLLGLPISAVLVIGGLLVGLVIVAGVVIPASNRRRQARGGGTYGRPQQRS
jgi:hypothetical protein